MEKMLMCRICLIKNIRMYKVVDKNLHKLYETLTHIPFVTEDRRPMLACYFCFAKLKQCSQLQRKCLEAEELFTQMMNEMDPLANRSQLELFSGLVKTPIENISIIDVGQTESIAVKEEIPTVCERPDDVIEPKEHQSDDLKLKNADIGYSDVDVSAHHISEPDFKYEVPLMEIKIEIEEEEEELPSENQSARDTPWAPVAKNPQLHVRRTELAGVITEEQTKSEQSDTKVTQNSQNCTSKIVTKYKKPLTYKSRGNNTNETRIHADNPLKCDICQRCFSVKGSLTRHIRIHTSEKSFKCDICQRSFRQNNNLKRHIRTHSSEKPFKCDICQRCFGQKIDLISHTRIHTGEKPFKCNICERNFRKKVDLQSHIRTHTGEKPFKCDICQRRFSRKTLLTKHIRKHTVEIPC